MSSKPSDPVSRAAAVLFPKDDESKPVKKNSFRVAPAPDSSKDLSEIVKDENGSMPQLRVKAEEKGEAVKKFATAQGVSMHLKVIKAKRFALTGLHKAVSLLVPKKDTDK